MPIAVAASPPLALPLAVELLNLALKRHQTQAAHLAAVETTPHIVPAVNETGNETENETGETITETSPGLGETAHETGDTPTETKPSASEPARAHQDPRPDPAAGRGC